MREIWLRRLLYPYPAYSGLWHCWKRPGEEPDNVRAVEIWRHMEARLAAIILSASLSSTFGWANSPHYTFILPDKYVRWTQIVFIIMIRKPGPRFL
jgi:hypothetical protein